MLVFKWQLGQWIEFTTNGELVRLKLEPVKSGRKRRVKLIVDAPPVVRVSQCETDATYFNDGTSTLSRRAV